MSKEDLILISFGCFFGYLWSCLIDTQSDDVKNINTGDTCVATTCAEDVCIRSTYIRVVFIKSAGYIGTISVKSDNIEKACI